MALTREGPGSFACRTALVGVSWVDLMAVKIADAMAAGGKSNCLVALKF
jgi:hypothetical protein